MRTCVGCRTVRPKRELVRVVRDPGGELRVDHAGTASGRGAYVCLDPGCPPKAREAGLARALRDRRAARLGTMQIKEGEAR